MPVYSRLAAILAARESSMRRPRPIQPLPDLFAQDVPSVAVPVATAMTEQATLMALVSLLLTETARPSQAEARHEDHL